MAAENFECILRKSWEILTLEVSIPKFYFETNFKMSFLRKPITISKRRRIIFRPNTLGHNIRIFTKAQNVEEAPFYAQETINNGWSRDTLALQLKSGKEIKK